MSVVADLKDTSDTPGDESGRAPLIGRGSRRYGSDGDLQAPISAVRDTLKDNRVRSVALPFFVSESNIFSVVLCSRV